MNLSAASVAPEIASHEDGRYQGTHTLWEWLETQANWSNSDRVSGEPKYFPRPSSPIPALIPHPTLSSGPSTPNLGVTPTFITCPSTPTVDSDHSRDLLLEVSQRLLDVDADQPTSSVSISTRDSAFSSCSSPASHPKTPSQLTVQGQGFGEVKLGVDPTLTQQIEATGNEAMSIYESLKSENLTFPPDVSSYRLLIIRVQ